MTVNNDISGFGSVRPEDTMGMVLDALHDLVDYELAVVLGYDGADSLAVHTAAGPLSGPKLSRFSLSLSGRPDIKRLLAEGKPHLFSDEEDHLDTYDEILDLPEGHSCLVAPLSVGDTTVGMMTLDHRSCGVFSKTVLDMISVVSRLVAVALVQTEQARLLRANNEALVEERNRLLSLESDAFRDFAGNSPAWIEVKELLRLVAGTESPVLILGETGTGKEEAARVIHRLSSRSSGPFVALNCSALPASLAESELFGHEKGAFTGAQGLRKGRFELAEGGTLFLDEIGELPLEIQPKLLRAVQEGAFERVGGEKTVRVNVRIIAATHVDLERAVGERTFREDLFYRLSVFPVRLPPLRDRGEDVLLLAELFASRLRSRPGWEGLSFGSDGLGILLERTWPGNVRELKNAVERGAILSRGGILGARELGSGTVVASSAATAANPPQGAAYRPHGAPAQGPTPADPAAYPGVDFDEAQRRAIQSALEASGGKIYGPGGAAERLGLKPSTLQSKMKRLGMGR